MHTYTHLRVSYMEILVSYTFLCVGLTLSYTVLCVCYTHLCVCKTRFCQNMVLNYSITLTLFLLFQSFLSSAAAVYISSCLHQPIPSSILAGRPIDGNLASSQPGYKDYEQKGYSSNGQRKELFDKI